MPVASDNPYVGPRTFSRAEADRFFGREREARQLLSRVISERLLLFYAQSGAGKSSLIHTRLIPYLEDADFTVLPVGRVSGELPAGLDAVTNVFAFNLMLSLDQSEISPAKLVPLSLSDFLTRLTLSADASRWYYDDAAPPPAENEPDAPYVLIIDQFEEIVTSHVEYWEQRAAFFEQLDRAMNADPHLWVVLTLREDYVAALEPYAPLLNDRLRARFYMQRMGIAAALEAITRPAELWDRPFARDVAETLVDNLRQVQVPGQATPYPGQFVEPVQLQVVCYKLWASLSDQPPGPITPAQLQAAGDVDTALAEFYEQALLTTVTQTQVPEITLRRWFDQQLITEAGTRGIVYQGDRQTTGLPNRAVELLANQYLLRAELRSGGTWYELIHDRLVEPIVQANRVWYERRLQRNPLAQAMQVWLDDNRSSTRLLRGTSLQTAKAYADAHPEDTTPDELKFLAESRRQLNPLADAAQRWLEGGRSSDLLLRGHSLTEAENFAADTPDELTFEELGFLQASRQQAQIEQEQAAQAAKRRRYATIAASVVILVLIALLTWTAMVANTARTARSTAQAAATQSDADRAVAVTERANAELAKAIAENSEATAQAASLESAAQKETAEARRSTAVAAQAQARIEANKAGIAESAALASKGTAEAQRDAAATDRAVLVAVLTAAAPTATSTTIPTPLATATPGSTPTGLFTPLPTRAPTVTPTASATPDRIATVQAAQVRLAEVQATETAAALPDFPPPGRLVFVSNRLQPPAEKNVGHLFVINAAGGSPQQLTRDPAGEPNYTARTGQVIFSKKIQPNPVRDPIVALFTIGPNGENERGIDTQEWDNWEPAWSPDGAKIAFNSSFNNFDWEIYSRNRDGSDLQWLNCGIVDDSSQFGQMLKWAPAWSPDGTKIAFVVSTQRDQYAGAASIWVMNADGSNCQPLTAATSAIDKYPDWSPDSRQIVFVSNRNGTFELFTMDADGQNQRPAPTPPDMPPHLNYPAWSPDGNWFSFSASPTAADYTSDDIFVMRIDGQHLTNLTHGTPGQNENWYSVWLGE